MTIDKDFLILYGSQTGQGDSIADEIYAKCIDMKLDPRLHRMDESDKHFHIEKEKLAVIVISSTGDGEPPENAHRFFRKLNNKSLDSNYLSNLEFALLGLGDSNYSTYQGAPKKLEKLLMKLGANKILKTGEADDQVGLELAVEPWIEKLCTYLAKRFKCNVDNPSNFEVQKSCNTELNSESINTVDFISNNTSTDKMNSEESNLLPHLNIEVKNFPENQPSLIKGSELLSNDQNLRVPVAPQSYVSTSVTHEKLDITKFSWQNDDKFPGQYSKPIKARVTGTKEISLEGEVRKPKNEIEIMIQDDSEDAKHFMDNCDAGDSVYFTFSNPKNEVDFILDKLSLLPLADNKLKLNISSNTEKRDPKLPGYIPNPCTLRYLLTYCVDIRRAPGRPLLRIFAEYAKDEKEKRRLLELCSAQGVQEFTTYIRQAGISIVDLMIAFPSSTPPIDRLIELLPRLIPRPYSVSNHRSRHGKRIRFVYSMLKFEGKDGIQFDRYGVCSTYLKDLKIGDEIHVILKEPSKFRLPPISTPNIDIMNIPLILIGPGTGVAPFASFFQKLLGEKLSGKNVGNVKRYLFYGSMDLDKEFILKDELESLNREGIITDLILCESQRESGDGRPKYVQEALKIRGKEITDLIFDEKIDPKPLIFACGDAKGMSKDLFNCFSEIFQEHLGKTPQESLVLLKKLKDEERYIEDVWSKMNLSKSLKAALKRVSNFYNEKPKKLPKIWPNTFVAFRIKNQNILQPIQVIHDKLLQLNSKFETKLVPIRAMHITLMISKIEDEHIESAKKAMESIGEKFRIKQSKLHVHFHGINSFSNRVLYGAVKQESLEQLQEFQKLVTTEFNDHGIQSLDNRPIFQPHLTIARGPRKSSEKELGEQLISCIDDKYLLGSEEIDELLLCKMNMDKLKDNFYKILHTEPLISRSNTPQIPLIDYDVD